MDSSPTFSFLPPPPNHNPNPNPNPNHNPNPNPNHNPNLLPAYHHHHHQSTSTTTLPTQSADINTTLSALKHLIHLSKTTINSFSNLHPTTVTATCPYNSNHRLPPSSLFHHHLRCPSSLAPIDLSLLQSLRYPHSIKPPITTQTDLSDSNFFYRDCPAVVTFPKQTNNNADRMLSLPAMLSSECNFTGYGNDDVSLTIDGLFCNVKLLPSEYYNVRLEISQWNDYPSFYSRGVSCLIVCYYVYRMDDLKEWMLVNSPYYGVVSDVFMRDHMLLLFRVCLKAIAREATGYLLSVSKGERGDCPVLNKVLMWLASQYGILYGELNGKFFVINMLKQALLNVSSKCLILNDESSSGLSDFNGETVCVSGSKENDGRSRDGMIFVSQVEAAVAALHERSAFETRIKGIRASQFVPVYQRVQEHEYISKVANEERKKRPNYRPIIEHDGVLWHRGGSQDSYKNKSQEELLAEERDYKRRRMSYRGKKIKRSTTQVMRDIIDEYMEEIKHAYMAGQPSADATNLESEPHADKHRHSEIKQKTLLKESVFDISMRSARYEDEVREKSNTHRHKDNRSSIRTKDRSSSPRNRHRSTHKFRRSSCILPNEFEDRYDPSE